MPEKTETQKRSYLPVRDQTMPHYRYPATEANGTLTVRNRSIGGVASGFTVLVNGHLAY